MPPTADLARRLQERPAADAARDAELTPEQREGERLVRERCMADLRRSGMLGLSAELAVFLGPSALMGSTRGPRTIAPRARPRGAGRPRARATSRSSSRSGDSGDGEPGEPEPPALAPSEVTRPLWPRRPLEARWERRCWAAEQSRALDQVSS